MNSSLQDIQADIQRLANQQKQIQATQEQQLAAQHKQMYQQTGYMTMTQHSPYVSQQSYNAPQYQQGLFARILFFYQIPFYLYNPLWTCVKDMRANKTILSVFTSLFQRILKIFNNR